MTETADLLGQLVMVDFAGTEPTPEVEQLVAEEGVGGIVLFAKNVRDPQQVARLTRSLQELAARAGGPPLLIATDQEGGSVARLREGATVFPSAMAFGAARSEALVAAAAGITARELRAVGIHVNFAPVLDVNTNPRNPVIGCRSYGEDPELVARLGAAAIRAMQAAGVAATAKHFPGHGDTSQDSHLALPTVEHSRDRLEAVELLPFRAAIGVGVAAVMTAHVVLSSLDPVRPATLSPAVHRLLREELGFSGVVVTDSLAMRAITDRVAPEEAAVLALQAGADLLLACGPHDVQCRILLALRHALRSGRLPVPRVVDASSRVLSLKHRLGLGAAPGVAVEDVPRLVGIPAHEAVAAHVAEAAVTVVGDPDHVIPLPPGPVSVALDSASPADDRIRIFGEALVASGRTVVPVASPDLGNRPPGPLCLLVPGEGPPAWEESTRLGALVQAGKRAGPVVVIAVGSPYVLSLVPRGTPCLALYGDDPHLLRAAARVLVGSLRARGRLPVTLPATA